MPCMVPKLAFSVCVRDSWAEILSAVVARDFVVEPRSVTTAFWLSRVELCWAPDACYQTRMLVVGVAVSCRRKRFSALEAQNVGRVCPPRVFALLANFKCDLAVDACRWT